MGSWKIMPICLPRRALRSLGESSVSSWPFNLMLPDTTRPLLGSRSMTDRVVTLLPQPDSPTMHTVSFSLISKEMPRRTSYSFLPIRKVVTRSFTSSTFPIRNVASFSCILRSGLRRGGGQTSGHNLLCPERPARRAERPPGGR